MDEANKNFDQTDPSGSMAKSQTARAESDWFEKMVASPEVLAATLEGFEQIRRGDAVRITRKKK